MKNIIIGVVEYHANNFRVQIAVLWLATHRNAKQSTPDLITSCIIVL